jgi:drug/metabolite transporter (DMT)-like permease
MQFLFTQELLFFYLNAGFFYIADILQKITSEKRWTWAYLTIRSAYTFAIAFFLTIILFGFKEFPDTITALKLVGCSAVCGGGLFFYIRAVNQLKFSNVGSLYLIGNVLQHLIGILFLNESYLLTDIPAFVLMSFGCIYQLLRTPSFKGAGAVLLSSFCWTIGYILLSFPLKNTSVYWSVPLMEATILVICVIVTMLSRNKHADDVKKIKKEIHPLRFIGIGLLVSLGSFFNNMSFRDIPVSVISILQLSLIPITFILSLRIFRERLTTIEWISFATGFSGFALFVLSRI